MFDCPVGQGSRLLAGSLHPQQTDISGFGQRCVAAGGLAELRAGGRGIEHVIGDLERVASHIWILRDGRLTWQGELDELKETVVRVHLRADRELDPALRLPNQLLGGVAGRTASFTVSGWHEAQLAPLLQRLDVEGEVEPLELEEIFLALHA